MFSKILLLILLCYAANCFSADKSDQSTSKTPEFLQYCLPVDSNQCLATDSTGKCVCDLQLFNSFAMITKSRPDLSVDSVRKDIFNLCLRSIYFNNLATEHKFAVPGLQQNIDYFYKQIQEKNYTKQIKKRYSTELLQYYFKNFYKERNGVGTITLFPVVISTDSMYIDSIYKTIKSYQPTTSVGQPQTSQIHSDTVNTYPPWTMLPETECPKSILKILNVQNDSTIKKFKINGIGYAILCGRKLATKQTVSFDDIREKLKKIAAFNDTSLNKICNTYYTNYKPENNYDRFKNDSIRMWLIPEQPCSTNASNNNLISLDTSRYKPILTSLMDIPSPIFECISRDSLYYTGRLSNPGRTPYGILCYQKFGSLPQHKRNLLYSKVEQELKLKFAFSPPTELEQKKSAIANAFSIMLTGMSFSNKYSEHQPEPTEQEILEYVNNKENKFYADSLKATPEQMKNSATINLRRISTLIQMEQWRSTLIKTNLYQNFLE